MDKPVDRVSGPCQATLLLKRPDITSWKSALRAGMAAQARKRSRANWGDGLEACPGSTACRSYLYEMPLWEFFEDRSAGADTVRRLGLTPGGCPAPRLSPKEFRAEPGSRSGAAIVRGLATTAPWRARESCRYRVRQAPPVPVWEGASRRGDASLHHGGWLHGRQGIGPWL